jgi:predicted Rossmann-fold nucleotide-binding protein
MPYTSVSLSLSLAVSPILSLCSAEFHCILQEAKTNPIKGRISLDGWVFQDVDLTGEDDALWNTLSVRGATFLGCTLPRFLSAKILRARGANVLKDDQSLPFKQYRAFLYTQNELAERDATIYEHYKKHTDLQTYIAQSVHDFSIEDALYDYVSGKPIVAIMGGHGSSRCSAEYRQVVFLCRDLAKDGFLVATGGGPGAMEAANLGAYMRDRTDEEVDEALAILRQGNDDFEHEYMNTAAAHRVIQRFGETSFHPSLGIPTWKYGHEPSNTFASFHAKFFSNAIREDALIQIVNIAIIYTPGSAGTRQEVFQDACRNHYNEAGKECAMVFMGEEFWTDNGVYELLKRTSQGRPYHDHVVLTSSPSEILQQCVKERKRKSIRPIDPDELIVPWWYHRTCPHSPPHF